MNQFNPRLNEYFMLEIPTVGLSWKIENDSVMQVVLSKIDISYHWIFKTCCYWRLTFELALIWLWNLSIWTKNKEVVTKTLQVRMIGHCSPAGSKYILLCYFLRGFVLQSNYLLVFLHNSWIRGARAPLFLHDLMFSCR